MELQQATTLHSLKILRSLFLKKPPEVPKESLKIGVITILSGPGALLLDPGLKVLQMEVDKINADGGILRRQIKLNRQGNIYSYTVVYTSPRGRENYGPCVMAIIELERCKGHG